MFVWNEIKVSLCVKQYLLRFPLIIVICWKKLPENFDGLVCYKLLFR